MVIEQDDQEGKWPVLGTTDLEQAYNFYVRKLNFSPAFSYKDISGEDRVIVCLNNFSLILQRAAKNGPILSQSQQLYGDQSYQTTLVLYISVPDCIEYQRSLKAGNGLGLSDVVYATTDFKTNFRGFYVKDADGNLLNFFTDYRSLYDVCFWQWYWEDARQTAAIFSRAAKKTRHVLEDLFIYFLIVIFFIILLMAEKSCLRF